jgi:hypothetical protein
MRMDPPLAPPCNMRFIDYMHMCLERQGNTANMTALFWFDGQVPVRTFSKQMLKLCHHAPKLSQIPVGGSFWSLPRWVDVRQHAIDTGSDAPLWKVEDNIEVVHLDIPNDANLEGDADALGAVELETARNHVAEVVSQTFDYHRPLWRARVISGFRHRTALILSVHHTLTDGAGLAAAMVKIFSSVKTIEHHGLKNDTFISSKTHTYSSIITMLIASILAIPQYLWLLCNSIVLNLRPKRNVLCYAGPKLARRRVAWAKPISMEKIKRVRALYPSTTLNDVMLASVSNAFRHYINGRFPSIEAPTRPTDPQAPDNAVILPQDCDKYLCVAVPLAMRRPDDVSFENRAIGSRIFLPVLDRAYTSTELLTIIHRHTSQLKRIILLSIIYRLSKALFSRIPGLIPARMLNYYIDHTHMVVSNVLGPMHELYVDSDNAERHFITSCAIFPPSIGRGTVIVGLTSYHGYVYLSAMTDATEAFSDIVDKLMTGTCQAFDELYQEAIQRASNEKA